MEIDVQGMATFLTLCIGFLATLLKMLTIFGGHDSQVQDRLLSMLERLTRKDLNGDGHVGK